MLRPACRTGRCVNSVHFILQQALRLVALVAFTCPPAGGGETQTHRSLAEGSLIWFLSSKTQFLSLLEHELFGGFVFIGNITFENGFFYGIFDNADFFGWF